MKGKKLTGFWWDGVDKVDEVDGVDEPQSSCAIQQTPHALESTQSTGVHSVHFVHIIMVDKLQALDENGRFNRQPEMAQKEPLISKHGGYRKLKSFQVAQLVYDVTIRFCDRYVPKRSRTHDQMVQAARSGVQNIAEGSQAAGTSSKTELKLTNVARASLEELRLDYEDFLRQRSLPLWDRQDPRRASLIARRCTSADCVAQWVREQRDEMAGQSGQSGLGVRNGPSGPSGQNNQSAETHAAKDGQAANTSSTESTQSTFPEIAANAALVLIAVACSLLDRQLAAQAKAFEQQGGFTERLYRVRKNARGV